MKNLLPFLLLVAFSNPIFGQSIFDKAKPDDGQILGVQVFDPKPEQVVERCPVYNNTPIEKVSRPPWNMQVTWDFLDMPKQGEAGFNVLQNYSLKLTHNLSRTLFAYGTYGIKKYDKTKFVDSKYGDEWEASYIFLGGGVYISPTLKVYAGYSPYFEAKDEDGNKPKLDAPIEYGIEYDIAWNGNKFVFGLREVMAPQKTSDGSSVVDSQGDAGFVAVSAGFSMPIEW